MDISDRLFEAMKEAGFPSQSALARASGIPQPTINRILNRIGVRGPEFNTLKTLAETCNVSLTWLQEGLGPKARNAIGGEVQQFIPIEVLEDNDPRFVQIKMVPLRLTAGIRGGTADWEHDEEATRPLDIRWVQSKGYDPKMLVCTRIKGESMEPTLHENDIIVINTADDKLVDGGVFAVNYEGEAVVKRLVRDAGEWWLESDNQQDKRYKRKICRGEACKIVGRVVRKESDML